MQWANLFPYFTRNCHVLSKSFVHDIGLTLLTCVASNAPVDAPADDESIKCHHCNDRLKVYDMRMHNGMILIVGEVTRL